MRNAVTVKSKNWGDIAGVQSPKIIRQFEGISKLDPFSIEDNKMVKNKNISSLGYPSAKVREGYNVLASVSGKTNGLAAWKNEHLVAVVGGSFLRWNGSAWSSIASGLSAIRKSSFTNFKGNFTDISLVVANGVDPVKVYDGSTLSNLQNAPSGMNYVVSHDNRLYGAVKNELHYSALRKATDWTTVDESGHIVIENNGGEQISGMVSGTGKIVAFMPHSIHELYGTGPHNFQMQLISDEIGCVSHYTAITVGGTLYFLSHDGIYRYSGGAVPRKDFSLPVQEIVDRVNTKAWGEAVAGTDGERYYISLPIDGSNTPNITLEFDPRFQTWNIWDYGFTPSFYARIEDRIFVGAVESRVVEMGGTTNGGSHIPYSIETKPFTYGSLAANNRLFRLWVVADVPIGATLNIFISNSKDKEDWDLVKTLTASTSLVSEQILIPVDKSFHENYVRIKLEGQGPVTIHEITRQERTFRMGIGGI